MKETDRAYAAGIIDGEGCISLRGRKVSERLYTTPSIEVTNTNRDILVWLQNFFSGGIYLNKDERPTRKPC